MCGRNNSNRYEKHHFKQFQRAFLKSDETNGNVNTRIFLSVYLRDHMHWGYFTCKRKFSEGKEEKDVWWGGCRNRNEMKKVVRM